MADEETTFICKICGKRKPYYDFDIIDVFNGCICTKCEVKRCLSKVKNLGLTENFNTKG